MLTDEKLESLTEALAEEAEFAQQNTNPADPEQLQFLEMTQDVYTCLRELATWRRTFPGTKMKRIFTTEFGVQTLQ